MIKIETEKAPLVSLVVDNKDAPPTSSEDPIEHALRLYLTKAPEDQQEVMQNEHVRRRVLDELKELEPVLPILERVSKVSRQETRRMGVESRSILDDRIASACKIAILEENNRLLAEERGELIKKLRIDALTGAASTYAYHTDVVSAMEKSIESGRSLWLYAVDVDGLKKINDLHGHEVGNIVLQEITRRLEGAVRRKDAVYRPGGDEFLLLSSPDDEEGARALGGRLLKTVNSTPISVQTDMGILKISVSISVGISQFHGTDVVAGKKAMEISADRDMYNAKQNGKNCGFLKGRRILNTTNPSEPTFRPQRHLSIVRGS